MNDLARVVKLGELLVARKQALEEAEQDAARIKAEVLKLEREDVPNLMAEVGVTNITLTSGKSISIKEDCSASISAKNKPKAFAWLLKHGFSGIIKTAVSITFGRGDHAAASQVTKELSAAYPDNEVELDEAVHPSTLKSFVKEQLEAGSPVPADLFGVYVFNKAVIKE